MTKKQPAISKPRTVSLTSQEPGSSTRARVSGVSIDLSRTLGSSSFGTRTGSEKSGVTPKVHKR